MNKKIIIVISIIVIIVLAVCIIVGKNNKKNDNNVVEENKEKIYTAEEVVKEMEKNLGYEIRKEDIEEAEENEYKEYDSIKIEGGVIYSYKTREEAKDMSRKLKEENKSSIVKRNIVLQIDEEKYEEYKKAIKKI